VQRIGEPVVVHEAGQHHLAFARLLGDRAGAGVVLACLGAGVAVRVVTELTEGPGRQDLPETGWLRYISASRACPKQAASCLSMAVI
jgi:hypothetical protein